MKDRSAIDDVRDALRDVVSQPKSAASIVVDEIKIINKGSLKAFAKVTIGGGKITIHSIRIIQQDGQEAWIAFPQNELPACDGGKPKYFPVVEVHDRDLRTRISDAVLTAYQTKRAS
jgi:DNA-binding cell septation regulator SpoVG